MTTSYSSSSPYYNTQLSGNNTYLGIWVPRPVPASPTDKLFTINGIYNQRPDLLAHDLYGDARLWWVFAMRNPNTLRDPLGDFVLNKLIYLPDSKKLKTSLGI